MATQGIAYRHPMPRYVTLPSKTGAYYWFSVDEKIYCASASTTSITVRNLAGTTIKTISLTSLGLVSVDAVAVAVYKRRVCFVVAGVTTHTYLYACTYDVSGSTWTLVTTFSIVGGTTLTGGTGWGKAAAYVDWTGGTYFVVSGCPTGSNLIYSNVTGRMAGVLPLSGSGDGVEIYNSDYATSLAEYRKCLACIEDGYVYVVYHTSPTDSLGITKYQTDGTYVASVFNAKSEVTGFNTTEHAYVVLYGRETVYSCVANLELDFLYLRGAQVVGRDASGYTYFILVGPTSTGELRKVAAAHSSWVTPSFAMPHAPDLTSSASAATHANDANLQRPLGLLGNNRHPIWNDCWKDVE